MKNKQCKMKQRSIRKRTAALVLSCLMAFSLTACSGQPEQQSSQQSAVSTADSSYEAEASKQETSKTEASEAETSQTEASKTEASQQETSKAETSQQEVSQTETSKPADVSSDTTKPEENGEIKMNTYLPTTENVKVLGRTKLTADNTLWLAFSGSGAEFTFNGTSAEITMAGDSVAISGTEDNKPRIAIYVNGERKVDELLSGAEKTFKVFESDTAQDVTVTVIKLSETAMSTCAIKNITVESTSGIKPTPKKDLFIEFVGDSITCGYGVDDEDKDHHFKTGTEDVTKAYAYKTVKALDADYSMVSISGYGIISGYTTAGKIPAQTIPQYYDKLGFSYGSYNDMKPQDTAWDFSYKPDVIVINLGTNDDSYTGSDTEKQQEYKAGYIEFLKKVREKNPDSIIVCALGIMGANPLCKLITKEIIPDYTAETGDSNIHFVKFAQQSAKNGYAADWHPTDKTHTLSAEKLISELKTILGL